jgi:hypothetical protein
MFFLFFSSFLKRVSVKGMKKIAYKINPLHFLYPNIEEEKDQHLLLILPLCDLGNLILLKP